jgi:hypothetical protein
MSNISTIMTGIETTVQAALGTSYKKLDHILNVEKNKWKECVKRWGVLPGSAENTKGVTQANTLDHGFRIILTDEYISDILGDAGIITKQIALMGEMETVFKKLVNDKCGAPSIVRFVGEFAIDESMIFREPIKDKVIIVEGRFTVRSQINL